MLLELVLFPISPLLSLTSYLLLLISYLSCSAFQVRVDLDFDVVADGAGDRAALARFVGDTVKVGSGKARHAAPHVDGHGADLPAAFRLAVKGADRADGQLLGRRSRRVQVVGEGHGKAGGLGRRE